MDTRTIGLFIAALRREKGWTQADLAGRLSVTDKAVSRWETGHGLPDVSLLKPLGDALGVSVNELLSGRRLVAEDQPSRADAIILETIRRADGKVNRTVTLSMLVFGALLLIFGLFFLGYDTSWVSIFAWPGVMLIAAAVFYLARKKPLRAGLLAALVLVGSFGLFEASDYHRVANLSLPPLFIRGKIVTSFSDKTVIEYHKPFYTVYRYNPNTPQEYYEIK